MPVLTVIREQVRRAIVDGEAMLGEALDDGRWQGWVTNTGDLIERALGSRWRRDFEEAFGGDDAGFAVVTDSDYGLGPTTGDRLATRNDDVGAKLGVARAAVHAIDEELERRRAERTRPEVSLPDRSFDFVTSAALRAIVQRDYAELQGMRGDVVKARALLAGSVIEAVLVDSLARAGFSSATLDELRFAELINEAAVARLIQNRTMAAANSVRDFRNFVHPSVELREGRLRVVDADAAVALMNMVLEDLA